MVQRTPPFGGVLFHLPAGQLAIRAVPRVGAYSTLERARADWEDVAVNTSPGTDPSNASMADGLSVGDVDEGRIIALLLKAFPTAAQAGSQGDARVEVGPGDDAALVKLATGRLLATVDSVVDGQDFLGIWPCGYATTGEDVGYKSAAQNLSDINAMAARSTAALVALNLPKSTPLAWVEGYAKGFARAACELGARDMSVIGGDLSAAGELCASVTMLGEPVGPVALRTGARPGDRVIVAGEVLGRADVSLRMLLSSDRENRTDVWGELEERVSRGLFEPHPPLMLGPAVAGRVSALMDVSDGLVADGRRLAKASGVGLDLSPEALESEAAELASWGGRHVTHGLEHVLFGGEDHLLLGTSSADFPVPDGFRQLGVVVEGGGLLLDGKPLTGALGFDHFSNT